MYLLRFVLFACYCYAILSAPTVLATQIDADAAVVQLRSSCQEGGTDLNNCFTTMPVLMDWMQTTRIPSATNPLLVKVGPGTFGSFECQSGYYVTLRGSGKQSTFIGDDTFYGMNLADDCSLNVQDLTVKTAFPLGGIAFTGYGNGITTWTNVDVISITYGWTESCAAGSSNTAKHYWFNSRIVTSTDLANGQARAYSSCSQNWFFESEITAIASSPGTREAVALILDGSETHVYGSVIRAIANAGITLPPAGPGGTPKAVTGLVAVSSSGGETHMHGTSIDVLSTEGNQIIALLGRSGFGGMIHADETVYHMNTGTGGTMSRIASEAGSNGTHIHAPYLTQNIPNPPVNSSNGVDRAIIISPDGHPHLTIYSSTCPTNNWFDATAKKCM